jgi:hypothetical protein
LIPALLLLLCGCSLLGLGGDDDDDSSGPFDSDLWGEWIRLNGNRYRISEHEYAFLYEDMQGNPLVSRQRGYQVEKESDHVALVTPKDGDSYRIFAAKLEEEDGPELLGGTVTFNFCTNIDRDVVVIVPGYDAYRRHTIGDLGYGVDIWGTPYRASMELPRISGDYLVVFYGTDTIYSLGIDVPADEIMSDFYDDTEYSEPKDSEDTAKRIVGEKKLTSLLSSGDWDYYKIRLGSGSGGDVED